MNHDGDNIVKLMSAGVIPEVSSESTPTSHSLKLS